MLHLVRVGQFVKDVIDGHKIKCNIVLQRESVLIYPDKTVGSSQILFTPTKGFDPITQMRLLKVK